MNSKMALVALVSTLAVASLAAPQMGTMTDSRDGQTYKTVKIGDQVWMAENLNYKTTYSVCYDGHPKNCTKYGRLYTIKSLSQVCPNGWHLPDSLEFITLINELGLRVSKVVISKDTTDVVADVGNYLKSTTGWNNNGNGSDLAGFSAIPGGNLIPDPNVLYNFPGGGHGFFGLGYYAHFWTSDYIYVQETHKTPLLGMTFSMVCNSPDAGVDAGVDAGFFKEKSGGGGYSVRCIKDDKKGKEKLDSLRKEMTK